MSTFTNTPIERVSEYWDARPCNIRHSPSEVGTLKYFDEVQARRYFVEPHIRAFAEFEAWKGKKVLEIGCGIGTDGVNFARAGADYVAIELSEVSLDLARKQFAAYEVQGTFYRGNSEEILSVIPLQSFDLIYSFGVIHHTPHPQRVVDAVRQFMAPNSEFRLMMYAKNSWKNIMIESGFDQPEAQSGCPIAYTYTEDQLRSILKDYQILSIHQDHIFPFVVEKYVRHEYELQPWFKHMPEEMFRALKKALGWHMLIRCKSGN